MKKIIMLSAYALIVTYIVYADGEVQSEIVGGVTWYFRTSMRSGATVATVVAGADAYAGDLSIPEMLNGCPVYSIEGGDQGAFRNCAELTAIHFPTNLRSIGNAAFKGCASLATVYIPDTITALGQYVFEGCTGLKSIRLPCGLASLPRMLDECSSLTDIVMPTNLVSISAFAFSGCSSLRKLDIPKSVTSIGRYSLQNCTSLTRLDIPASVTFLGEFAVRGCSSLQTLTVAEGNQSYKGINNCIVSASGTTLIAVPFGCVYVDIPVGVTEIPAKMFENDVNLVNVTIPAGVTSIGDAAFCCCENLLAAEIPVGCAFIGGSSFYGCVSMKKLSLSRGLMTIGSNAFYQCSAPEIILPLSVVTVGNAAFYYYSPYGDFVRKVVFLGAPPSGVANSYLLSAKDISYPREYGAQWLAILNDVSKFNGYNQSGKPEVKVLSSQIRASDPTILDVVYKVTSSQPTVKVRALAFEDGVRSFANVVRPETFVADTNGVATAGNVGDAIVPNVEHTLSWRVASDWSNRLAKVTFEVLASEGDLLPLEVRTIPASEQYGKMDVTWNAIAESQWYDALMWLYADKNEKVTVSKGICYYDGKTVANGKTIYSMNVQDAVLGEMGYKRLMGDVLNYANDETRLGLSPSGYRQYGYRIVGE